MTELPDVFAVKAQESVLGAESEFADGRFNNCANRCYYACFQAAVYALTRSGVRPLGQRSQWSHAFVPAQFDGQLIARRKLYPPELRNVLSRNYVLRQRGDYSDDVVSGTEAARALRRTRMFVEAILLEGGQIR